jgi:hypothetical protein
MTDKKVMEFLESFSLNSDIQSKQNLKLIFDTVPHLKFYKCSTPSPIIS